MMTLVGHDNYVRSALVAAILRSDGSAAKRLRKAAQEKGVLIDATSGNKTRSVLVLSSGQVVLCSLQPAGRKQFAVHSIILVQLDKLQEKMRLY